MSHNNRNDIGPDPKPSEVTAEIVLTPVGFGSDQF